MAPPPAPALPPPAAPLDEVQVKGIVRRILATDLDALVETIVARMIGRAHVQPAAVVAPPAPALPLSAGEAANVMYLQTF